MKVFLTHCVRDLDPTSFDDNDLLGELFHVLFEGAPVFASLAGARAFAEADAAAYVDEAVENAHDPQDEVPADELDKTVVWKEHPERHYATLRYRDSVEWFATITEITVRED